MSPEEHHKRAEELLDSHATLLSRLQANDGPISPADFEAAMSLIAVAQVHATLATVTITPQRVLNVLTSAADLADTLGGVLAKGPGVAE